MDLLGLHLVCVFYFIFLVFSLVTVDLYCGIWLGLGSFSYLMQTAIFCCLKTVVTLELKTQVTKDRIGECL